MMKTIEKTDERGELDQSLEGLIKGLRDDPAREIFIEIVGNLHDYFKENPQKGIAFVEMGQRLITSLRAKLSKNLRLHGDEVDYFDGILDLDRSHYRESLMLEKFVQEFITAPRRSDADTKVAATVVDIPEGLEALILMNPNLVVALATQET